MHAPLTVTGTTLPTIAREIFKRCGNVNKTVDRMIELLNTDQKLFRNLLSDIVRDAVHVHAAHSMRKDRRAILRRATVAVVKGNTRRRVGALSRD
jgi:hydroxyethylthiazole kinase-like sugar kinase family protein